MLADPQSVTVNAVAQSLPAISRQGLKSEYQKTDGSYKLTVSHDTKGKRERHLVRFDHFKTVADPLVPTTNIEVSAATYVVIDNPSNGVFTDTELLNDAVGILTYLTASSGANITKVLGLES